MEVEWLAYTCYILIIARIEFHMMLRHLYRGSHYLKTINLKLELYQKTLLFFKSYSSSSFIFLFQALGVP